MRRSWLRLFWLVVVLVGVFAGYLVSSGAGTRLLHREIETQLTRLVAGPVKLGAVEVRWQDGLQIEAREVSAYPTPAEGAPPALRARRVLAWVDLVALLIGRLELSTLVLEGPHVRLVQNVDGSFAGLPILPPFASLGEALEDRSNAERVFASLAGLDHEANRIAHDFRAADRIEVVDGTLEWIGPPNQDTSPPSRRVELVNGVAERRWLSETIDVEWRGVYIDGVHAPFPFDLAIHQEEERHFAWSLAISKIPLGTAGLPFAALPLEIAELTGTLDVRFRLRTLPEDVHQLDIEGRVEGATIRLQRSGTVVENTHVELAARTMIDPTRIRLEQASVHAPGLSLRFQGAIERPIRPTSPTRIEARTEDLDLQVVRNYAQAVQDESPTALTIARLTERVENGHVRHIEVAGTATLQLWQDLLSGRVRELPPSFVLGGAFEDVAITSGPSDRIEQIAGEVEWVEDQIVFRNGRAVYRGEPLPEIDAVVTGMSHLVRTAASARRITHSPPSLPGLAPFFELLRPRDPDAPPPVEALGMEIDSLEHPLFRWPFKDLRILIKPLDQGMEVTIRDGFWGGARVKGEVAWLAGATESSVSATLSLAAPPEAVSEPTAPETPLEATRLVDGTGAKAAPARWGSGRFEMELRPQRWLPFERAKGFIRFEGTKIHLDELEVAVSERGTIVARMGIDLDASDSVGLDTSFALMDGRLQEIGPWIALPDDLAVGRIDATGSLIGRVRPEASFIAELSGRVRADAKEGHVLTGVPLMFRLAKATEGYNPFASQDRLQYESMGGTFAIEKGILSVEDFEIEGPLRVYAGADIDTNATPSTIRGVVGIFLFRSTNRILDNLPLVRSFLPGSERGLIGTYFDVDGPLDEPKIEALPLQTLMSSVPDVIRAPFQVLRSLFERRRGDS